MPAEGSGSLELECLEAKQRCIELLRAQPCCYMTNSMISQIESFHPLFCKDFVVLEQEEEGFGFSIFFNFFWNAMGSELLLALREENTFSQSEGQDLANLLCVRFGLDARTRTLAFKK